MSGFIRIIKEGFLSFVRNGWLSVASITVMVLTLLTMSMFLLVNVVLNTGIKSIQDKIDLSVYLNDSATIAQVNNLEIAIAKDDNVKEHGITYVSKDDAMAKYREQIKDNPKLLESLTEAGKPLPASLEIKVVDPSKINSVQAILDESQFKPLIYYSDSASKKNKQTIDTLVKATQFTQKAGLIATIAFSVTALVIIFNTVRMAIFTRKEEIDIMKLVGATPSYIKAPFLVEGALYGIISTVISVTVLAAIFYFSAPALVKYFGGVGGDVSTYMRDNLLLIIVTQICVGVAIGVISSYLAIHKYLKTA